MTEVGRETRRRKRHTFLLTLLRLLWVMVIAHEDGLVHELSRWGEALLGVLSALAVLARKVVLTVLHYAGVLKKAWRRALDALTYMVFWHLFHSGMRVVLRERLILQETRRWSSRLRGMSGYLGGLIEE